jgi:hypothetical protein
MGTQRRGRNDRRLQSTAVICGIDSEFDLSGVYIALMDWRVRTA